MAKPKRGKTHFEQVPLELVKKIALVETADDATNGLGLTVKPPAKRKPYSRFSSHPH
jgi:hypothetical protein